MQDDKQIPFPKGTQSQPTDPAKDESTSSSSAYRDDTPAYFKGFKRGSPTAELGLRLGWITEEDLED